jgi:hypothetical protein
VNENPTNAFCSAFLIARSAWVHKTRKFASSMFLIHSGGMIVNRGVPFWAYSLSLRTIGLTSASTVGSCQLIEPWSFSR